MLHNIKLYNDQKFIFTEALRYFNEHLDRNGRTAPGLPEINYVRLKALLANLDRVPSGNIDFLFSTEDLEVIYTGTFPRDK